MDAVLSPKAVAMICIFPCTVVGSERKVDSGLDLENQERESMDLLKGEDQALFIVC